MINRPLDSTFCKMFKEAINEKSVENIFDIDGLSES